MLRYPYIKSGELFPAASSTPIEIGTLAWTEWLKENKVFSYQEAELNFTARCEERPGGVYWYAYKRARGKLHKGYLGRSEDLTLARFQEVARTLLGPGEEPPAHPEASALIATRFAIPRTAAEWLPRPQLLGQFNRALEHPCTCLTAHAGSGKTTLLAMGCGQLQEQGWRIAWISLENSERDPVRFWLYTLTALEQAVSGATGIALRNLQAAQLPTSEVMLTPLINSLLEQGVKVLLVLDDYHLAETAEIDAGLLFLIQHLPSNLRLVISSRSEPKLPLTSMRVQGQVAEIRQADLRFSPAETGHFLERTMGLHLDPEQIETLEERTEGWVAGLQLAALSLHRQVDVATFIANFAGSNRYVGEYLMGEVIAGLSSDKQDFLLRTAVLPRMCAALCNALTGRSDGQTTLEELEAANLFVISLDQQQSWYRYHHLFAEMLRERLARQNPALLAECHEKADRWFEVQGELRDAIEQALAAPAYPLAASLLATQTDSMLQWGEIATLLTWFQAIPMEVLETYPHLRLSSIIVLTMNGETSAATAAFQHFEKTLPTIELDLVLQGELAAARAFLILMTGGNMTEAMELAQEAIHRLPPDHGSVRDMVALLYGATQMLYQQNVEEAIQTMTQIARSSVERGNYLIASFALENRAIKETSQGRLHQAESTCREALRLLIPSPKRQELPFPGWTYLRMGDIYREWNQLGRARKALEQGIGQELMLRHPEIIVDGYIALARVYDLLEERLKAEETLEVIERLSHSSTIMPHTAQQVEAFRALLHLGWNNQPEAGRWVEQYERNIRQTQQNTPSALTEFSDFALARIQMAQERYAAAHQLLEQLLESAQTAGRGRSVIEASLLLALVEQAHGRSKEAITRLGQALQLAAPEGFVRLFLDESQPMINLLTRYLASGPSTGVTAEYARQLLKQAKVTHKPENNLPALPEALSSREMEILQLLAAGKSNENIATELYLALSTVKWHISHLYRKLDVSTRLQAIARARSLKLIEE